MMLMLIAVAMFYVLNIIEMVLKNFTYGSKTVDTGFGNKGNLEKVIEDMKVIKLQNILFI